MDPIKNLAEATLAAGIAADATTATLVTGEGADLSTGGAYDLAIWNFSDFGDNQNAARRAGKLELARVTRSGDTLTFVTRGLSPTTAIAHNESGKVYKVRQVPTKELFDQLAPKADGVHTGITQVALLAAGVTDLGTVANTGTVTLTNATADFEVTLTGTANPIALPSTPPGTYRKLTITFTSSSVKALSIPSLVRVDSPSLGAVTSIAFGASTTKAVLYFLVSGASFFAVSVIGDEPSIPASALSSVIDTDATLASPSNSKVPATQALVTYLAALLDALTLPYGDIISFPANSIAGRGTGDGALLALAIGAGLQVTTPSGVPTLSVTGGSGSSAWVDITGNEIDWTVGTSRSKTLTGSVAFTTSNLADGVKVAVRLTASGADRTPTWDANIDFGDQTPPTILAGKTCIVELQPAGAYVYASIRNNGFEFDTVAPSYVSTAIATDGNTFTDTYDEALHATIATTTGRAMTVAGANITGTSPTVSGSTVVWTASPRITSGTVTANAYTAPGTGIKDLAGNYAGTYSGRQADVTNGSTYTLYTASEDFIASSGTPSGFTTTLGSPNYQYTPALVGSYSLGVPSGASAYLDLGADKDEQYFFLRCTIAAATTGECIGIRNSAGSTMAQIEFRSDRIQVSHGSASGSHLATHTAGESCVWIRYKKSTGANDGLLTVWYERNGTTESPGSPILNITTGTSTGAARRLQLRCPASGTNVYDKIRASDSAIPNSPP